MFEAYIIIAMFKYYFYNIRMKFSPLNLILLLIICFLSACNNANQTNSNNSASRNTNQNSEAASENANSAKDDIDELAKIIKLPLMPEEVSYWEDGSAKANGDNQTSAAPEKTFVVVLKYSPENAALLVGSIEKIKPPVDSDIETERRFPAELVAQSQLSGDETLKGKSYAADDFIQPPYKNGKITRIENTDYFVLELTTD